MKKFRYRLGKILSLKTTLKKQVQKEFAEAENDRARKHKILTDLKTEYNRRLVEEKSKRKKKLDVAHLDETQKYFAQLNLLISHQFQMLRKAENLLEEKREKLLEATREEKKYQRLKEIRKSEYNYDLEKALQKETDEFARNVCARETE